MNAYYKILNTSIARYRCIVFATSYVNPMDQKDALEKDLMRIGIKGKILFDLLLSHGNNQDRYFEAFFNGEKINEESLKSTKSVSKKIKKLSSDFFLAKQHYLDNSVLSRAQKFLIRKKIL